MKYCFTLLALLLSWAALAQAPKQFSYQAVVRNNRNGLNSLAANQQVSMRVSILRGSPSGTATYVETHLPTTNANGLFTVQIGAGTRVSGQFAAIKWSMGAFYLKTEIDPDPTNGLTTDVLISTSQLLSVPYALHAQVTDSAAHALKADTAAYARAVRGHYIGELFGGGIIFNLWRDAAGVEHGLIASLSDIGVRTWATPEIQTLRDAESHVNGAANTAAIVARVGANSAAGVANAYAVGSVTDWYLPSTLELRLLYDQSVAVNAVLEADNDPLTTGLSYEAYWSSTIADDEEVRDNNGNIIRINKNAFRLRIDDNEDLPAVKSSGQDDNDVAVRAIRRF